MERTPMLAFASGFLLLICAVRAALLTRTPGLMLLHRQEAGGGC